LKREGLKSQEVTGSGFGKKGKGGATGVFGAKLDLTDKKIAVSDYEGCCHVGEKGNNPPTHNRHDPHTHYEGKIQKRRSIGR